MENETLKKAIEKAVENGYLSLNASFVPSMGDIDFAVHSDHIIFSHDFAKAFWGEEEVDTECVIEIGLSEKREPAYLYHLQQLAIAEDRIKYLEQFI